ncbi:MAG: universal stress protein [Pseudomonadota bacterium]
MSAIKRILCVLDPHIETQRALERAELLAANLDADLDLLVSVKEPTHNPHIDSLQIALEQYKADVANAIGKSLEGRAKALRARDIRVTTLFTWHRSLAENILQIAQDQECDLIIKDTHYHSAVQRALYTDTDRHLLRSSPIPVWLVRVGNDFNDGGRIIGCVDPMQRDDKDGEVAANVLATGAAIAHALNGSLHALYVHQPLIEVSKLAEWAVGPRPIEGDALTDAISTECQDKLAVLGRKHGLDQNATHFALGSIADVLPGKLTELDGALAVLGRSRPKSVDKAILGSTAERILDHAPCDILLLPTLD